MQDQYGLPRELGDGLLLRWGTPEDAEELAAFNVAIHSDNPDEPQTFLAHWTRDLMNGRHPTTQADDFTLVVDRHNGGKIVSTLNLISQRWTYEGIEFGVGRPELVGTLPEYRRRGLIRTQMDVVHAKSAARGEMVQAITGIRWYYRQFGYEMAINLGGGREFFWQRPSNGKPVETESYQMRPATLQDIPRLMELYAVMAQHTLIQRVRDAALWEYEIAQTHPESPYAIRPQMIETPDGEVVAYAEFYAWDNAYIVREFCVQPGHSWRAVGLFLTRALKAKSEAINPGRAKPIDHVSFALNEAHPLYHALGRQLEQQRPPYAWYVRVPDLSAFLRHIAPALEHRLAQSVMAGHTGKLRLSLYRQRLELGWENGRLQTIAPYTPKRLEEGDAAFPDLTFLQLLFGHRSLEELYHAFADCYVNDEAWPLLESLFPKRPSFIVALG